MRFTVAAAALASTVSAVTTDYLTEMITITSCAPEVTNCPAASTKVTSKVVPVQTSTVWTTREHTITSCGPEVTKCPAHSTVVVTETVPAYTTVCPVTETETGGAPAGPTSTAPGHFMNTTMAAPTSTGNGGGMPAPSSSCPPEEMSSAAATTSVCVPSWSSTVVTKTYTTVLTSVETSSVKVPCPTTPAGPSGPSTTGPASGAGGNGGSGSGSSCPGGANCPGGNGTSTPPVTAGAGSLVGSAAFAAIAGVAAYVLA